MMKCPKCGNENVVEIASSNSHRQWLCSDCGNVIRTDKENPPTEQTTKPSHSSTRLYAEYLADSKEKDIREKCVFYSRAWEIVGIVIAAILVISGLFVAINEKSLISFIVYSVIGVLVFLSASTVSVILTYFAFKK